MMMGFIGVCNHEEIHSRETMRSCPHSFICNGNTLRIDYSLNPLLSREGAVLHLEESPAISYCIQCFLTRICSMSVRLFHKPLDYHNSLPKPFSATQKNNCVLLSSGECIRTCSELFGLFSVLLIVLVITVLSCLWSEVLYCCVSMCWWCPITFSTHPLR